MLAPGRRSDDGTMCTLLVVYENDGTWSFQRTGCPRRESLRIWRNGLGERHPEGRQV